MKNLFKKRKIPGSVNNSPVLDFHLEELDSFSISMKNNRYKKTFDTVNFLYKPAGKDQSIELKKRVTGPEPDKED